MAVLGFGSYRVSIKSEKHREALEYALDSGCRVIDTSSNYTNGDSEKLIGKVLEGSSFNPIVISKAGYIQGDNLDRISSSLSKDIVNISDSLKHSIHPRFLEDQLERSLERMGLKFIDIYLLHNPEYYLKEKGSTKDEYYRRIKQAFLFLEEQVKLGKIKAYGISSNTFIDPKDDHESTDIVEVYKLASSIDNHSFKYIQFPLNLLELGALERQFDGDHLIEKAHALGLKTIINRPLNAFTENGLVRLANYSFDEKLTDEFAELFFVEKVETIVNKWENDKDEGDESLFEIPLFKQISNIWYKQNSKDAVDQIFHSHLFPFVASIWGSSLSASESQPFYELYEKACEYALKNMDKRANQFKQVAINQGLLFESDQNLSLMAIEKYAAFGVDIILVGMKEKKYVEELKSFFTL